MGKKAETAELSIGKYLDEQDWTVQTNDKATAKRLERLGWGVAQGSGPYWSFSLPLKAIALRSRKTVEGFSNRPGRARFNG